MIITKNAAQGLEHCRRFLAEKKPQAARRAAQAIGQQFMFLKTNPGIGRPLARHPQLSELVIGFEDIGYIALYHYELQPNMVYVLAFRQYVLLSFRNHKEPEFQEMKMKIPPHDPKPVNGRCRCLRRGYRVRATPEEKVRQRVLNYLLKKRKYAKWQIDVEPRINYDKREKSKSNREHGRADIILLDEKEKPWLIIECKRSHENNNQKHQINDDDIKQAKDYAEAKGVSKIWVTTGDEHIFRKKHGASWLDVNPSLSKLKDTEFWHRASDSAIQFPKSNSTKDIKNYFKKDCPDERYKNYFDEFTDEAIFVSSIQKLIYKLNFQKWIDADRKKRKGFKIIEDLGVTGETFGNPGYGPKAYQNRYRTIVCKYAGIDEELKMSLGVYPEKNSTSLCIGVRPEDSNTGHHSLELNYQRYVDKAKDGFELRHTRGIGGGQLTLGKAKFSELIKYMENHDIKEVRNLIRRDTGSNPRIELGKLPFFWSRTTDGLLSLVRNLFLYGAVRHQYREENKK